MVKPMKQPTEKVKHPAICPVCGRQFMTDKPRQKYCSDQCAKTGAYKTRREWVNRSGYNDKQRQKMRERRAIENEAKEIQIRQEREAAQERQKAAQERAEREHELLQERAAAGDPFARMALSAKDSREYWEAFRDYELAYAAEAGRECRTTVSGIPVTDPIFPALVVSSIRSGGQIITQSNYQSE